MKAISVKCVLCGEESVINLTDEEEVSYDKWKNREMFIQDALPNHSAAEREMLISGVCPKCWDRLFADTEESEGNDSDETFDDTEYCTDNNVGCSDCPEDECTGHCMSCPYRFI